MFIQSEETADPRVLKFLPGREVLAAGTRTFADADAAAASPLAARLFEIEAVTRVTLAADAITVSKSPDANWQLLKPAILGVIMEHFMAGTPVLHDSAAAAASAPEAEGALVFDDSGEDVAQIKDLIETRIRPAAQQSEGDVIFRGYKDGVVYLEMEGGGYNLQAGIENMLRHYVPDVVRVRDYRDAIPKPGLGTPDGIAVQRLLDERINPAVAGHGGHIALVDVQDDTVYIRLEGGCQGCGMADVTLKHGVESEIREAVPAISAVLDVTDHAGGNNPYFQPGKEGTSPL